MRSGASFPRYGYTRELTGRTVGIIGFGAVTRELLTMLAPFETETLVYSRHAAAHDLDPWSARVADSVSEIARKADVVVVLTGLTEETFHLIDGAVLQEMKDGALLINTARGKIIDETALVAELQSGRIRAALDVYEDEPLGETSPLRHLDNVTITAHSANSTREMDAGRWTFALRELRGYASADSLTGELDASHIARMSDD